MSHFDSIVGLLIFLAAMLCIGAAGLISWRMLYLVNQRLPPEDQIEIGTFQRHKWGKVWRNYSRLYPNGILGWIVTGLAVLGFALLVYSGTF